MDVVGKVVEFLLGQDFCQIPEDVLRDFVSAVARLTRRFMLNTEPVTVPSLGSGAVNPRFCFQAGVPETGVSEFRTFAERFDTVIGNLLRLAHEICATEWTKKSEKKGLSPKSLYFADCVLEKDDRVCENLLVAMSLCYTNSISEASDAPEKSIPSLISVADWILQALTTIDSCVSDYGRWMACVVRFLSEVENLENERGLSGPLVYFLRTVLNTKEKTLEFLGIGKVLFHCILIGSTGLSKDFDLDGGKVLGEQLMQSSAAPISEDSASQCSLMKSLASVSGQIKGMENGLSRSSKKSLESKVDGMTNYAPLC